MFISTGSDYNAQFIWAGSIAQRRGGHLDTAGIQATGSGPERTAGKAALTNKHVHVGLLTPSKQATHYAIPHHTLQQCLKRRLIWAWGLWLLSDRSWCASWKGSGKHHSALRAEDWWLERKKWFIKQLDSPKSTPQLPAGRLNALAGQNKGFPFYTDIHY